MVAKKLKLIGSITFNCADLSLEKSYFISILIELATGDGKH